MVSLLREHGLTVGREGLSSMRLAAALRQTFAGIILVTDPGSPRQGYPVPGATRPGLKAAPSGQVRDRQ